MRLRHLVQPPQDIGVIGICLEPTPTRHLVSEPGELALHIGARVGLSTLDGVIQPHLALQVSHQCRRAMGTHDRQQGIQPAGLEQGNLGQRTTGNHVPEACIDALMQDRAVRSEEKLHQPFAGQWPRLPIAMITRERAPRGCKNLKRPHDTQPVAGAQCGGTCRIALRETGMEFGSFHTLATGADSISHILRQGRNARQTLFQRLEVEARASDQDWQAARNPEHRELLGHGTDIATDGEILRTVHETIEPVIRRQFIFGRRPRREQMQIAIDLHRIGIDDHPARLLRQTERESRLAACCRTCNEHRISRRHNLQMLPMTHVATLVSNPAEPALAAGLLAHAAEALPRVGATTWLKVGIAADILFTSLDADLRRVADTVRAALDAPIDVIVQPVAHRRKRLFLADMDSTMIGQECIDELADYVGLKGQVSDITERAMRGELAFEPALRERVALLNGLPVGVVDEIISTRITLTPGSRELVRTMRGNGAYTALVSGGFTVFTSRIGVMIGFHEDRSNLLETTQGKLSGTVREPILGQQAKRDTLVELRERAGLAAADTMAVGDGANDLAMLGEAGLGVAFRAKPAVAAAAHARIDHADLTALLYAQGYAAKDFVTG